MRLLSELSDGECAALADPEFQEVVQDNARELVSDAFDTYSDVMHSSDDDQARVKAADKILALAGYQEKQTQSLLPSGVSEEVFKIALAGLGQLAGIARSSASTSAILRDVTPAKSDPRPQLAVAADDSPLNRKSAKESADNDAIPAIISKERYEIRNPENQF